MFKTVGTSRHAEDNSRRQQPSAEARRGRCDRPGIADRKHDGDRTDGGPIGNAQDVGACEGIAKERLRGDPGQGKASATATTKTTRGRRRSRTIRVAVSDARWAAITWKTIEKTRRGATSTPPKHMAAPAVRITPAASSSHSFVALC